MQQVDRRVSSMRKRTVILLSVTALAATGILLLLLSRPPATTSPAQQPPPALLQTLFSDLDLGASLNAQGWLTATAATESVALSETVATGPVRLDAAMRLTAPTLSTGSISVA